MQSVTLCGTFERSLGSTATDTGTVTSFELSFPQYGDRPDGRIVCTAFGKTGERALELRPGMPAIVQGYLEESEYQGEKKIKLIVQNIIDTHKPILLNSAIVVGRMGGLPDVKYFEDGKVVSKASLAVPKAKANVPPTWLKVELWGKVADVMANHCIKGSLIGVEGQLTQDHWRDSEGNPKTMFKIKGDRLRLLGNRPQESMEEPSKAVATGKADLPW